MRVQSSLVILWIGAAALPACSIKAVTFFQSVPSDGAATDGDAGSSDAGGEAGDAVQEMPGSDGGPGGAGTGGTGLAGTGGAGGVGTGGAVGAGGSGKGGTPGTGGDGAGGSGAGGSGGAGSGAGGVEASCPTGQVFERYAPAACVDPGWAEWPMPNAPVDVAAGAPNANSYTDNNDGTITDNVTKLMWQKVVTTATYVQSAAITYCATTLNTALPLLGGHNDWRLPSIIELVSLLDIGQAAAPFIDPSFAMTPPGPFWSSSPVAGLPSSAWAVSFGSGIVGNNATALLFYFRCVR